MTKQTSVVIQLQEEALDKSVPLSDLLRKAFIVARKLGLAEFQAWIENELNGYGKGTEIPKYREAHGQIRGWNPYRGWQPIIFQDPKMGELLSRRYNNQSIAELEALVEGGKEDAVFHMPFPQEQQRILSKACDFDTEYSLFTPHTTIIHVLDAVRNIILNWALRLEEDGILGEGLAFTTKEKSTAETKEYNITNFYGPVNNPQLQQGSDNAVQLQASLNVDMAAVVDFLKQLRGSLNELGLPTDSRAELDAELQTVQAQAASPKPKHQIVREGLLSIRKILESAGGGVAAHLLIEFGKLFI